MITLAHDSLTQLGGAEKVVDALHGLFPDSPLYVLVKSPALAGRYKDWDVRTSRLQRLYDIYPHFQYLLPFIPWAVSEEVIKTDILLSSSSGFAKGFRVQKPGIHIDYCHTPTRFLWSDAGYVDQEVPRVLRLPARIFLRWMRRWDLAASRRVDYFIANSREVQKRIKEYYGRDSEVIYPPVNTDFWHPTVPKAGYFLVAGRLQAHKNNELIVTIMSRLALPLRVVGTGRQEEYLRKIAGPSVTFYGRVSDEELRDHYSGAVGLIYPQVEDAGLMPLEAAACGTASLGLARGGSLETIIPGQTGELFPDYREEIIEELIKSWDHTRYRPDALRAHAERFGLERFKQQISQFISRVSGR